MSKYFITNLEALIKKYGLKEVSAKTGYSTSTINNILSNRSKPSLDFLCTIKESYNVGIDEFLDVDLSDYETDHLDKFIGNYIVYYYNNSTYKGEIHTNTKNVLNHGVISIFMENGFCSRIKAYARFFKDKDSAGSFLDLCNGCGDITEVYKEGKNVYEGELISNTGNFFISLVNRSKDDNVAFSFNNPPSNKTYIGGIGSVNSVSRGREHNPCIQFAILSRKIIEKTDGEIYNYLVLDYAEVNFKTSVSELVSLFKRLYTDENELSANLNNEQKELIVENKLKYYFNEVAESNMFRFAKVSNQEDDNVYRMLKENNDAN